MNETQQKISSRATGAMYYLITRERFLLSCCNILRVRVMLVSNQDHKNLHTHSFSQYACICLYYQVIYKFMLSSSLTKTVNQSIYHRGSFNPCLNYKPAFSVHMGWSRIQLMRERKIYTQVTENYQIVSL